MYRYFFAIALLLITSSAEGGESRRCVLVFERVGSFYAAAVDYIFQGETDTLIIHEATPRDFARCIHGGFFEITIIAHSVKAGEALTLGYLIRRSGLEEYDWRSFPKRLFRQLDWSLGKVRESAPHVFRKLRWVSCNAVVTMQSFPDLDAFLRKYDIELVMHPRNEERSRELGMDVVTLDPSWLRD